MTKPVKKFAPKNAPTNALTNALEARYYTDPAIYENELQGLLSRSWQYAGHMNSIPRPGDYFTFRLAGENLFCMRGRDGEVRTFYNVCRHRAHELFEGSGNVNLIVCPYHSWTYNLAGELRKVPNMEVVEGFDISKICLSSVRTELFNGFIFVNLDDEADSMDTWYPGVRTELREYVPWIEELAPMRWVEEYESCNWKVSVENYNECYHCEKNHRTLVDGVMRPETYDIEVCPGYVLRHTTKCQNLERMTYPVDLSASEHADEYCTWYLWPLFAFQHYPGGILNVHHWRVEAVDGVTIRRGWFTKRGEQSSVINELADQDRRTTLQEDIFLIESVQRGLNSRGYKPGPLVVDPKGGLNSEHSILALNDWMRKAVAA